MEMRTNTAERLDWPVVATGPRPAPEPEPQDLTACLRGPHALDLLVDLATAPGSGLRAVRFLAAALQEGQGGAAAPEPTRPVVLIYSAPLRLCGPAGHVFAPARGGNRLVARPPPQ